MQAIDVIQQLATRLRERHHALDVSVAAISVTSSFRSARSSSPGHASFRLRKSPCTAGQHLCIMVSYASSVETVSRLSVVAKKGILILPEHWSAGAPLHSLVPGIVDTVLEINVTPNRPDALGHAGSIVVNGTEHLRTRDALGNTTSTWLRAGPATLVYDASSRLRRADFIRQIVERLQALPGVLSVAATDSLPLTSLERVTATEIEGRPPIDFRKAKRGEVTPASRPTVTADYFTAMGIPVKRGRGFTARDTRPGTEALVVNEAFEKHHFPGGSAVGKRIRLMAGGTARWQTIVGVVGDVRQGGLASDTMLEVYSPELNDAGGNLSFVLRVAGEPAGLMQAARGAVLAVAPSQPIHGVMTMEQRLARTTTSPRLNMALLGSFAAVANQLGTVRSVVTRQVAALEEHLGVKLMVRSTRSLTLTSAGAAYLDKCRAILDMVDAAEAELMCAIKTL